MSSALEALSWHPSTVWKIPFCNTKLACWTMITSPVSDSRVVWRDVRMFHGREFREFFDELANASRDQLATSASVRWRESLAAARSTAV